MNKWRRILCGVPLAMALAMAVMQYRSYRRADVLVLCLGDGSYQSLSSFDGRVEVCLSTMQLGPEFDYRILVPSSTIYERYQFSDYARSEFKWSKSAGAFVAGMSNSNVSGMAGGSFVYLSAPHWSLWTPILLLGAWQLAAPIYRKQRWIRRGLCLNCGYDLRASKERCPECGTVSSIV